MNNFVTSLGPDFLIYMVRQQSESGLAAFFEYVDWSTTNFISSSSFASNYHRVDFVEAKSLIATSSLELIKNFIFSKSAFFPFWRLMAKQKIQYLMRISYTHTSHNAISLEELAKINSFKNSFMTQSENYFVAESDMHLSSRYLDAQLILEFIDEKFSDFEKKALNLWMKGYDYPSMAKKLVVSSKKIDNTLQKIFNLLRNKYNS